MNEQEQELRPDIAYSITNAKTQADEDYDLEEEDDGFHCHECGWRALSLPMNDSSDNIMKAVCPDCEEEGVENKLSTHIDEIREIYAQVEVDDGFVPYSFFRKRFDPPQDRLDEAMNHLLTQGSAYVVFEDGVTQICVSK